MAKEGRKSLKSLSAPGRRAFRNNVKLRTKKIVVPLGKRTSHLTTRIWLQSNPTTPTHLNIRHSIARCITTRTPAQTASASSRTTKCKEPGANNTARNALRSIRFVLFQIGQSFFCLTALTWKSPNHAERRKEFLDRRGKRMAMSCTGDSAQTSS